MKNRRKNLRIVSLALVIALLATSFVFADDIQDQEKGLVNTDQLAGGGGIYSPTVFVFPGVTASVSTTIVSQPALCCAGASSYIALYGLGLSSSISGTTEDDKIHTLQNQIEVYSPSILVSAVRDVMNSYAGSGSYVSVYAGGITFSQFRSKVFYSLKNGYIPILHAKTGYLPYYGGYNTGHYIPIQSFDSSADTMTLYDTNNNSPYYGVHVVSASDAFASVSCGRYLIYHP